MYEHPPGGEGLRHAATPAPLLPRPHRLAGAQGAHPPPRPGLCKGAQLWDGGAGPAGVGQLELDTVEGCVLLHREVLQVTSHLIPKVFIMIGILSEQQVSFHLKKKLRYV